MYGSPELTRHYHPVVRSCRIGRRPRHTLVGTQAYVLFFDGCDRRWLAHIADTPCFFRGMRLDRFDAPLARGGRLLDHVCFGVRDDVAADAIGSPLTGARDGAR